MAEFDNMTCTMPEQQELEFDLDNYETFRRCVLPLLHVDPEEGQYVPIVGFLGNWTKINGFISTASWTKKLLLKIRCEEGDFQGDMATRLVCGFGHALRGDEVGALGRDIIEYALKRQVLSMREAAVQVLERWLKDDDDGLWLDLLNDHIDFESDRQLKNQCAELVQIYVDNEDPPELEEFLEVGRRLPNRARAQVETRVLPGFLKKLVGADRHLVLAVLESIKVGKLVAEDTRYGFLMTPVGGGWQLRAWCLDGSSSFSVEPTAGDNWLVFTRF
jgi:hypothetical protein